MLTNFYVHFYILTRYLWPMIFVRPIFTILFIVTDGFHLWEALCNGGHTTNCCRGKVTLFLHRSYMNSFARARFEVCRLFVTFAFPPLLPISGLFETSRSYAWITHGKGTFLPVVMTRLTMPSHRYCRHTLAKMTWIRRSLERILTLSLFITYVRCDQICWLRVSFGHNWKYARDATGG